MNEPYDSFKLLFLGDVAVGKTCLFLKFSENTFDEDQISTIGFDYRRKVIDIDENKKVSLTIWDTAGQEKFRSITKNYYKGANGIIVVYDVTVRQSFKGVEEWIKTIHEETPQKDIQLMIIGNKADLVENKKITTEEGREMAKKYNCEFFETSAKMSTGIDEAFITISKRMIEKKSCNKKKEEQINLGTRKKKENCCGNRK